MNVLQTHLTHLRNESSPEKRLSQMIYMWQDGIPILGHSCILEDATIHLKYLEVFLTTCGLQSLVSLRTKKVFLNVCGIRVPMAGGRTLLHLVVEHEKEEAVQRLLEAGFPSLPDDYGVLPEDLNTSEEIQALLRKYNRIRSPNAVEKVKESFKQLLAEKPTADTFREPFLDCYRCPPLEIPAVDSIQAEPLENGSVFVIRNFLSESMRTTLLELYRTHLSSSNRAPNSMSKKGYSLRPTKLETLGYHMSRALNPYAKILGVPLSQYPEIAHGFFVSYEPGSETLEKHRDGGFWTANLCLKADDCDQRLDFETESLKMEEGMLVLHKGCVPHAVSGSCNGARVNLIFWFY